jgi:hypothetical protein
MIEDAGANTLGPVQVGVREVIAGWDLGILGDAEQGIPPMKVLYTSFMEALRLHMHRLTDTSTQIKQGSEADPDTLPRLHALDINPWGIARATEAHFHRWTLPEWMTARCQALSSSLPKPACRFVGTPSDHAVSSPLAPGCFQ